MSDEIKARAIVLSEHIAGLVTEWAREEGILERVTGDEYAVIAKAFLTGYVAGNADEPCGFLMLSPSDLNAHVVTAETSEMAE